MRSLGRPPGSYEDVEGLGRTDIALISYSSNVCEQISLDPEDPRLPRGGKNIRWLRVRGGRDAKFLEFLRDSLGIHDLTLEDLLHPDQQPRLDIFPDYAVLFLSCPTPGGETTPAALIIKKGFVISFMDASAPPLFRPLRERIARGRGRIRRKGADYLFYSLVDIVVDLYYPVISSVGDDLEKLEEIVYEGYHSNFFTELHGVNRRIMGLRRLLRPLRESLRLLSESDFSFFQVKDRVFLRDVRDHCHSLLEQLETFRETHDGMFQLQMSHANRRMNATMRMLAVISTIFIPLNFLAGIYGMNFKHIPGTESPAGFYVITVVMLALGVAASVFLFSKRRLRNRSLEDGD